MGDYEVARENEKQLVRQQEQLDGLTKVVDKLLHSMEIMKNTITSIEKSSSFISGAFKGICIAVTVISFLIIYREPISHIFISLNSYSKSAHYAVWSGDTNNHT